MRGAPLRFAGAIVVGWTTLRILLLWPGEVPLQLVAPVEAATPVQRAVPAEPKPVPARRLAAVTQLRLPAARPQVDAAPVADPKIEPSPPAPAPAGQATPGIAPTVPQPFAPAPVTAPHRKRLAVDAWMVARGGRGDSLAFGQLGASQAGTRITYALDDRQRIAASARLSAPLKGRGSEVGLGFDIRPSALPVHLLIEQRIGLDGGGSRPAATVVAGASRELPARVRLDGYAQGGAVLRRGGFVDAAMLAARPIAEAGRTRVELGAGGWGAAQRGAARLDVGPVAAVTFPAGRVAARLQLDYRVRIAGRAQPGNGFALTLGGSF